jgi:RNA polymerase sigma-70 factor (ECF subfamily)
MTTRDVTLSDVERLQAQADEAETALDMDEDTFRAFYDRTARPLWAYLARMTGDTHAADDLLQEAYYRLLRTSVAWGGDAHRRAYLFRIATNLVRDKRRRAKSAIERPDAGESAGVAAAGNVAEDAARRTDVRRAMARLRPRDRALLWLAYAQGQRHAEIAQTLGVKTGSIKLLLFRARRRLAGLLRGGSRRRRS